MRKLLSLSLLVLCAALILLPRVSQVFCAEQSDDTTERNYTLHLTQPVPREADAGEIAYPVTGGSIYFDPAAGTITGSDKSITEASIPGEIGGVAVTGIGDLAFANCAGLERVTIPNGVTCIGQSAFWCCGSLTGVTIPDSVTSIGNSAFSYCGSLTGVTIPDGVTGIEMSTFSNCSSLIGVTIPNSVTSIGNSAFSYCSSLTGVTIPDGVTSIGEYAFYICRSLASVTIPDSVASIGKDAFYGCGSLTSVSLPNRVVSLEAGLFGNCGSLASVIIPGSVTNIDYFAFDNCASLTDVYYGGSSGQWSQVSIGGDNAPLLSAVLHCGRANNAQSSAAEYVEFARQFNGKDYDFFRDTYGVGWVDGLWCASFVTWCAQKTGLSDIIPYSASTSHVFKLMTDPNGKYAAQGVYFGGKTTRAEVKYALHTDRGSYIPQMGDLIFFAWTGRDVLFSHIGLVTDYDGVREIVYFVDGNSGKGYVKDHSGDYYYGFDANDPQIAGYVRPNYTSQSFPNGSVIYRFHGPVEVEISYDGESLNSAAGRLEASFGTLTRESDGSVSVTVQYGAPYNIAVMGTAAGTTVLDVLYQTDKYQTEHHFENVPVTSSTDISMISNVAGTYLLLSENGAFTEAWYASDAAPVMIQMMD